MPLKAMVSSPLCAPPWVHLVSYTHLLCPLVFCWLLRVKYCNMAI